MTRKLAPIETHKEKDLRLIRDRLLKIIKDENSKAKDITDASKLLARVHKALLPEKIEKISPEEKKSQQELTEAEKETIRNALAGLN